MPQFKFLDGTETKMFVCLWFSLNWLLGADTENTDGHFFHQRAETSTDPAKTSEGSNLNNNPLSGPEDDDTFAWQSYIYLKFAELWGSWDFVIGK